jgi:hypothetical protein
MRERQAANAGPDDDDWTDHVTSVNLVTLRATRKDFASRPASPSLRWSARI